MKVEKFAVQSCCGKTAVTIKVGAQVSKDFIPLLVGNGYTEVKQFTASGMLYVENMNLIVSGVFGADNLQIKCKVRDCEPFTNEFIELLATYEG